MSIKRRITMGLAAASVLAMSIAVPAAASGTMTWNTTPGSNPLVSKSQNGCTARGSSNSTNAATTFTDATANSGYACVWVKAQGYVFAGTQGYWTTEDKDALVAKSTGSGITTGKHQQFVE